MKPLQSDRDQKLDQLADGLDAGWDIPDAAPVSLRPSSAPLPEELDELDADWDAPAPANVRARCARAKRARIQPEQSPPLPCQARCPCP